MKILTAAAAIALLCAPLAFAAGPAAAPFDGTWKTRLDTIKISGPPDVYEIKDGVFRCDSCVPPFSVKADGTDQKVTGHSYYDTVSVKVVDARTVEETAKLGAKTLYAMKYVVSADGKTLNLAFRDMSGAKVATWSQVSTRVADAPAGAHAMSGSWKTDKVPGASDVGTIISYHETADGLQMHYNGMSYDAKFDGKPVLTANDPGKTYVVLKRVSDTVIEETDTRAGKVTDITRMTVSADGKSMTIVDKDQAHGATMSWTMDRQP
jgi:hypothetical protein